MKKALIVIVILLMLFFILCSFSSGEPSSTAGEFVKGNPLHCPESCFSKNCLGGEN